MAKITRTDGYKFSMAEAGAALRPETFYYSHRRGGFNGWHYMPVDVEPFIKSLLPEPTKEDYDYLSQHSYEVGASFRKAFTQYDQLKVVGVPKGSWFYNREPAFSVAGPSAVVSWLEPSVLALQYVIQLATAIKTQPPEKVAEKVGSVTCIEERELVLETFEMMKARTPTVEVRREVYFTSVFNRAKRLIEVVKNPDRIFEVGMRAVSCPMQHAIALEAIRLAGVKRTSNVELAQQLGMIPVGTMGHEHVQRYRDDYEAYIAMRDRFPGFLFYLPDTYDTLRSGIPSALQVIAETPERDAGIRFDSEQGIRGHYFYTIANALQMGLKPRLALESGWNYDLTVEFERLREMAGWQADRQAYGYGGYLVKPDWPTFARDDVSAVWKISQTGSCPTMKFGDEPDSGKQSLPGRPVIWRTNPIDIGLNSPAGYIAQEGEDLGPLTGFQVRLLSGNKDYHALDPTKSMCLPPKLSPETAGLVGRCQMDRSSAIARAAERGTR